MREHFGLSGAVEPVIVMKATKNGGRDPLCPSNDWGVSCGPQARQLHARVRRLSAMGASPVATQFNVTMSVSGYA